MEGKFLYFANAIGGDGFDQDEMITYPATSLRAIEPADGGTTLNLWFTPAEITTVAATDDADLVQLTVTALKHKEVVQAIVKSINASSVKGLIVVADEVNSIYLHTNITAVAAITKAA
mgnify:CR=1 FL=1|tara:strand:+ start:67 stop:420 length:354 start_codon:yes stop_codon:yes gene_type:complete